MHNMVHISHHRASFTAGLYLFSYTPISTHLHVRAHNTLSYYLELQSGIKSALHIAARILLIKLFRFFECKVEALLGCSCTYHSKLHRMPQSLLQDPFSFSSTVELPISNDNLHNYLSIYDIAPLICRQYHNGNSYQRPGISLSWRS